MRVVYLAHALSAPTRAGIEANRARAARWATWIATTYRVAVIADWIWLTGLLDETPANRAFGLACDLELVQRADEVWMVGALVSNGMKLEAIEAYRHGKMILDLTATSHDNEPPAVRYTAPFLLERQWHPANEGRGGAVPTLDEDEDVHVLGGEG